MKRRDFLKNAGAAIVPVTIPGALWGTRSQRGDAASSPVLLPITAVVYDERYADCKIFADALVARGAVAFAASHDSASLWYGALLSHLARHGGCVAGLTTDSDFAVSRACGRELNLRIRYEGAHDARASHSTLTHRIRAAARAPEIAAALARPETSWPVSLAEILCRIPSADERVNGNLQEGISVVTTPRSRNHPGYLTSWLLAPTSPSSSQRIYGFGRGSSFS